MKRNNIVLASLFLLTSSLYSCKKNEDTSSVVEKYKVTFNTNGGKMPSYVDGSFSKVSDEVYTKEVEEGKAIGKLPTPTKNNYIFLGWFLGNETSDGQLTSTSAISSDVTVYARYKVDNESISLKYDSEVQLEDVFTIESILSDELKSDGVKFTYEANNCVVKVSEDKTSISFKAIKTGTIEVTAASVSNPSKSVTCKINIVTDLNLIDTMKTITSYNNYTYTGFSYKGGVENVDSILKATALSISQLDNSGLALFSSEDNNPRFGIAYNDSCAFYIDSKDDKNICNRSNFNTNSMARVRTDLGLLTKDNFQGVNTKNLNESGDIYGFKAINPTWLSNVKESDKKKVYYINGSESDVYQAMVEAALLKMTWPSVYNEISKANSTDFPYIKMANDVETKITLVNASSIFVEITRGDETHYGRFSNINSTIQNSEIDYVARLSSWSKTLKAGEVETDIELMGTKLQNYKYMRTEGVSYMAKDNQSATVNSQIKTFFNQSYIYTYYPDDYLTAEKENKVSVDKLKCFDKDRKKEGLVGYTKGATSTFSFRLPYYKDGTTPTKRDSNALDFSPNSVMSGSISDNFLLVNISKAFFKSNLKYTFKTTASFEGNNYLVSYSDDVYNQVTLPNERNTTALRRVTYLKVNKTDQIINSFDIKIGHLEHGDSISFDANYNFDVQNFDLKSENCPDLVDPSTIASKISSFNK